MTREQLKRLKKDNFVLKPNGNLGKHKDKAKERVFRTKASYEKALHELDELNTLRSEAEENEVIRAVRRSGKSFQEAMSLIRL